MPHFMLFEMNTPLNNELSNLKNKVLSMMLKQVPILLILRIFLLRHKGVVYACMVTYTDSTGSPTQHRYPRTQLARAKFISGSTPANLYEIAKYTTLLQTHPLLTLISVLVDFVLPPSPIHRFSHSWILPFWKCHIDIQTAIL